MIPHLLSELQTERGIRQLGILHLFIYRESAIWTHERGRPGAMRSRYRWSCRGDS